jgi:3-hydroxyisobutyrate dehydrogenase
MTTNVAVLGTGTMGRGMTRSLLRAGFAVTVWNRTASRAQDLRDAGARVAADPAEAVAEADVVVTVLFDEDAVARVAEQALPAMRERAVWVQSATVGPTGARRLAALAGAHGVAMIDAPVLGTRKPAEDGTLVVLASGPVDAGTVAQPVLDAIGSRTLWAGSAPGEASALKLAANAWVATITAGAAQSLALADALGVDPRLFLAAIEGTATDSPYAHVKGEAMLTGAFDTQFALDGLRKDLGLIHDEARAVGAPLPVVPALRAAYDAAADVIGGEKDIAGVVAAFRPRLAGTAEEGNRP